MLESLDEGCLKIKKQNIQTRKENIMMDERRKGEIAYALLQNMIRKEGRIHLTKTALQEAVNKLHAETQIPPVEIHEFFEILVGDLVGETFQHSLRIKVLK